MTPRRSIFAALFGMCAIGLCGCAYLQQLLDSMPKPSASITDVRITDFSLTVAPARPLPTVAPSALRSVDAPMLGNLRLPRDKEVQLPISAPPEASIAQVKGQNVSLAGANGTIALRVSNPGIDGTSAVLS